MTRQDVYAKVVAVLCEALCVEEEEIQPSSTLQGDLGAASIDFLDIVFRLMREFDIQIPRGEFFPEGIFQGDPEYVEGANLTPKGVQLLRAVLPWADMSSFEKDPQVTNISDLYTVAYVARYIEHKLALMGRLEEIL